MTFSERRLHPRITTDLEAEVVSRTDGSLVRAQLLNVSRGGLRIGGNADLRDHIAANADIFPVETDILFELPQAAVRLTCRHIHTLRLSADAFEFGFKIVRCQGEAEQHLEAFVAQSLSSQ